MHLNDFGIAIRANSYAVWIGVVILGKIACQTLIVVIINHIVSSIVIHVERDVHAGDIHTGPGFLEQIASFPASQVIETEAFQRQLDSSFTTDFEDYRIIYIGIEIMR